MSSSPVLSSPVMSSSQYSQSNQQRQIQYEIAVDNLPFNYNESNLISYFNQCGLIKKLKVMQPKNKNIKPRAYIEFYNQITLMNALKLNNTNFMGNTLSIKIISQQTPQQSQFININNTSNPLETPQNPSETSLENPIFVENILHDFTNNILNLIQPSGRGRGRGRGRGDGRGRGRGGSYNSRYNNYSNNNENNNPYNILFKLPSDFLWENIICIKINCKKYDYKHYKFILQDIFNDFNDSLKENANFIVNSNQKNDTFTFLILSPLNSMELKQVLTDKFTPSITRKILDIETKQILTKTHLTQEFEDIIKFKIILKRCYYTEYQLNTIQQKICLYLKELFKTQHVLYSYLTNENNEISITSFIINSHFKEYNKECSDFINCSINSEQEQQRLEFLHCITMDIVCTLKQ